SSPGDHAGGLRDIADKCLSPGPSVISCAHEILAGLQPEQPILAEVVCEDILNVVEHALAISIGIFLRLDSNIRQRFTVSIEDTTGDGSGRGELDDYIGQALSCGQSDQKARPIRGSCSILGSNVSIPRRAKAILSRIDILKHEFAIGPG